MTDRWASPAPALAPLPGRDRALILAALAVLTGAGWAYLHVLAGRMAPSGMAPMQMAGMAMAAPEAPWAAAEFALAFVMWWVMMLAMMLPSAAPMILTFATVSRRRRERGQPYVPSAVFATGYLMAWGAFSVAATLLQWALQRAALLTGEASAASTLLGGALFVAAGLYQLTPLKSACLRRCRSPFDFVMNRWRDGASGALAMGLEHGLYCLGCCWVLMGLLFAEGVMNLLWVAAIAVLVLVEKLFPAGPWIARIGGVVMVACAIADGRPGIRQTPGPASARPVAARTESQGEARACPAEPSTSTATSSRRIFRPMAAAMPRRAGRRWSRAPIVIMRG
jgi:predicted metal-binding membrane protein